MKIFINFFVLFMCSVVFAFAQSDFRKGYVVTNAQDTMGGLIDYNVPKSNAQVCYFKKDVASQVTKYSPGELSSYGFEGDKQYLTKMIPSKGDGEYVFLELLFNGVLDLYYYHVTGRHYYFIEKEGQLYQFYNDKVMIEHGGRRYAAQNPDFIIQLRYLISDSDLPSSRVDNFDFNHKSLMKLLKDYQKSMNKEDFQAYAASDTRMNPARWLVNLGLSFGNTWSTLNMTSRIYDESSSHFSETGYFFLNYQTKETNGNLSASTSSLVPAAYINFSRNRHMSFQLEFQYQKLTFPGIEVKRGRIPLLMNYDFLLHKKLVPYATLGLAWDINMSTTFNDLYIAYQETKFEAYPGAGEDSGEGSAFPVTNNYNEPIDHQQIESESGGAGFLVGVGGKYQLSEKIYLKLDVRYSGSIKRIITGLDTGPGVETDLNIKNVGSLLSIQYNIF